MVIANDTPAFSIFEIPIICYIVYSSLSNKRAEWNTIGRLYILAQFGKFETLNLCRMDLNHIQTQIK